MFFPAQSSAYGHHIVAKPRLIYAQDVLWRVCCDTLSYSNNESHHSLPEHHLSRNSVPQPSPNRLQCLDLTGERTRKQKANKEQNTKL